MLTVGASRDAPPAFREREERLVSAIAARLGARVEWRLGDAHELLDDLADLELPLVAAAVNTDSPFADRVGLSKPYLKDGPHGRDYCLAVAPGENRLLLLVDRIIAETPQTEGER